QAAKAGGAEPSKLGSPGGGGIVYYLWTFTWGLGWVPALAALGGGALLVVRRQWALAAMLVLAPVAFVISLGLQARFFGRWLIPVLPVVAVLGGFAVAEALQSARRGRRLLAAGLGVLAVV